MVRSTASLRVWISFEPIPQSLSPFFHNAAVFSATSGMVFFSRRALLASIQGTKSSGARSGKERTRLVRSPLGSTTMAGIPCKAASSSNPTHKPVLPEPVMPVIMAWVVRSGGSYVKRSSVIAFFFRSNILPR